MLKSDDFKTIWFISYDLSHDSYNSIIWYDSYDISIYLIHYYSKPVNSLCHGPSDDDIYIKKVFFTLDQSPSPPATKNSFSLVSLLSVPILLQNSNNFMKIHNLDRKGYIRLYIFTQKSEISYDFLNFWSILDFFEHFKMILPLFSITLSWFLSDFRSKSLIFN